MREAESKRYCLSPWHYQSWSLTSNALAKSPSPSPSRNQLSITTSALFAAGFNLYTNSTTNHNFSRTTMALPPSEYISDIWKAGIFSTLLDLALLEQCYGALTFSIREQGSLLYRWLWQHLQCPSQSSRSPRRKCLYCGTECRKGGTGGQGHRDSQRRRRGAWSRLR